MSTEIKVIVDVKNKQIQAAFDEEIRKRVEPMPKMSYRLIIVLCQFYSGKALDYGFSIGTVDRDCRRLHALGYLTDNMKDITIAGVDRVNRMMGVI